VFDVKSLNLLCESSIKRIESCCHFSGSWTGNNDFEASFTQNANQEKGHQNFSASFFRLWRQMLKHTLVFFYLDGARDVIRVILLHIRYILPHSSLLSLP
jgi:hypothetical protein